MNNPEIEVARRVKRASTIDGWMDEPDLIWIANQANNSKIALEIGAWKGRTTQVMSLANKLVVIEPFSGSKDDPSCGPDKAIGVYDIFRKNCNCYKNVNICMCRSDEYTGDDLFDFIFIDGDHSFEAVQYDLALAMDITDDDSIIAGHDRNLASVQQALKDYKYKNIGINSWCLES